MLWVRFSLHQCSLRRSYSLIDPFTSVLMHHLEAECIGWWLAVLGLFRGSDLVKGLDWDQVEYQDGLNQ